MMGNTFYTRTYDEEIRAFRSKFGPQFKDYNELISRASFVFTNSNPYLDFPRPILHKTVALGGITVPMDPKLNELSKVRQEHLSNGRKAYRFSGLGRHLKQT
ncbi:hypothetical protein KIN20_027965 [Parelaphostrongylus tenuis]|uniref:glucuronosyltransferase n=1 Tax=Parelaphostrongylus tenuis TaxID=148309 RepID=A0AAD5R0F3_PARTN|nr:hypothetical protein KIN20_027965 [Parelaphostrongylus tenuis]